MIFGCCLLFGPILRCCLLFGPQISWWGDEKSVCVRAMLWVEFEEVESNWYWCHGSRFEGVSTLGTVFHALENLMWYCKGVGLIG